MWRLTDNRVQIEPYDPCNCGSDKKVKLAHHRSSSIYRIVNRVIRVTKARSG
jgi:hypothetical protein